MVEWSEVEWSEEKWSEVKRREVKWSEVKRSEVKWSEVKWSELKWSELKWIELSWVELTFPFLSFPLHHFTSFLFTSLYHLLHFWNLRRISNFFGIPNAHSFWSTFFCIFVFAFFFTIHQNLVGIFIFFGICVALCAIFNYDAPLIAWTRESMAPPCL